MKRISLFAMLLALTAQPSLARDSDAEIKQKIIDQSRVTYPGNCPCPFDRASNGSKCGARSAHSRPGGYSPKCYPRRRIER